jgi:hypothetical protein
MLLAISLDTAGEASNFRWRNECRWRRVSKSLAKENVAGDHNVLHWRRRNISPAERLSLVEKKYLASDW